MHVHITEYRVIYGDSDPFDVVYYANYFDFFERGRTELFRSLGLTYKDIASQGIFLPVSETYCKYHRSARYDDLLLIETSLTYLKRVSIRFDYKIHSKEPEALVAEGYTVHGFVDREGKIRRAPQAVLETIGIR